MCRKLFCDVIFGFGKESFEFISKFPLLQRFSVSKISVTSLGRVENQSDWINVSPMSFSIEIQMAVRDSCLLLLVIRMSCVSVKPMHC